MYFSLGAFLVNMHEDVKCQYSVPFELNEPSRGVFFCRTRLQTDISISVLCPLFIFYIAKMNSQKHEKKCVGLCDSAVQ